MSTFEVLCVTMHQSDFSKIQEMNIHSDVVFANQCEKTAYEEYAFDGHTAKMISTQTRGVGINRNLALMYASADICLFADDDVTYLDDMENLVVSEFKAHPDADVIIFHLDTDDPIRKQRKYSKTKKCGKFTRMPWGAFRIAFRLDAIKKANIWYSTLFGGGCVFPSGEDSMWLHEAKKKGVTFFVSDKTIGAVSFENSTWFTGADEKFYFAKGAYYHAAHPKTRMLWSLYFAFRTRNMCSMPLKTKIYWMHHGAKAYQEMLSFDNYRKKYGL